MQPCKPVVQKFASSEISGRLADEIPSDQHDSTCDIAERFVKYHLIPLLFTAAACLPGAGAAELTPAVAFKRHALGETLEQAKRIGVRSCSPTPYFLFGIQDKKIKARGERLMSQERKKSGDLYCFSPRGETMAGFPAEATYTFYRRRLERIEVTVWLPSNREGDVFRHWRKNEANAWLIVEAIEGRYGSYTTGYLLTGKYGMRSQPRDFVATWTLANALITARHPEKGPEGVRIDYKSSAYAEQHARANAGEAAILRSLLEDQKTLQQRQIDRRMSDI